jgi:hypothetical protein
MKHGRLFLAAIGVALLVVGVVAVFLSSPAAVIGLVLVIGLVALVLAVSDWTEFGAEFRDFTFRVSQQAPAPPGPRPELKILSIENQGSLSGFVDFGADVVNEGTKFCRAEIAASIDGTPLRVVPPTLDCPPNDAQRVRVLVPRSDLGDLVKEFNNDATLYGRTLTVVASSEDERAELTWREHVYNPDENPAQADIQQQVWRRGLGEDTEADYQAEMKAELLRRQDER